jgi:hypothetical protein
VTVPAAAPTTQSSSEWAAHPTYAPPGYLGVVEGHHGNNFVGFVKKCDIQVCVTPGSPRPEHFLRNEPSPVYEEELRTITGNEYPNKGFVPLGANPADVPDASTSTFTTTSTRPQGPQFSGAVLDPVGHEPSD